ncbi:MAG: PEP-CTERM sorting domain-containing protein [Candidatus Binatia bacterium]
MHYSLLTKKCLLSAAVCVLLATAVARATIYKEAISGDLSDDKAAPTALTLTPGFNSVSGTVAGFPEFGGTDPQDWVSFTIPTGFVMISYVNAKFVAGDGQGFTGFQSGSSFSGDEFVAGSYTGYAHFGTAAQNPDGNPNASSTVGVNLLPLMADPNFAPGTTNPVFPLGAGTYTFLIQQGDPTVTQYRFNMTLRPVAAPEPGSSMCLLAMGSLATLALRRRLGR